MSNDVTSNAGGQATGTNIFLTCVAFLFGKDMQTDVTRSCGYQAWVKHGHLLRQEPVRQMVEVKSLTLKIPGEEAGLMPGFVMLRLMMCITMYYI